MGFCPMLDPTYDKSPYLGLGPFRVSKGPKRAKYEILAKKLLFFSSDSQTKKDGRANHVYKMKNSMRWIDLE